MTRIVVDGHMASQLSTGRPAEFCDPSGKILGRFVPRIERSEWKNIPPGISEEELERRSKSTEKRYTTAEVIAHLESL